MGFNSGFKGLCNHCTWQGLDLSKKIYTHVIIVYLLICDWSKNAVISCHSIVEDGTIAV